MPFLRSPRSAPFILLAIVSGLLGFIFLSEKEISSKKSSPTAKAETRNLEKTPSMIVVKKPRAGIAQREAPMESHSQSSMSPGAAPMKMAGTERDLRLAELLKEAADEKDPREAQQTLLSVAGYQVGNGDWEAAEQTYEQLKTSPYPEIQHSVSRNLDVVHRNEAILAETDTDQREWLELDLAQVHQNYGHEKAAKRMLRSLIQSATQPEVREEASQRLANYVAPPLSVFQTQTTSPAP